MSTWDQRFLDLAAHIATWSKDPSTQCGSVIVDLDRRVVSTGYNGFPRGIEDNLKLLTDRDTKLRLTIHAEQNALLFANRPVGGCTLYVHPMPPCAQCAAKIIQAGIRRVVAPDGTAEQYDRWGRDWDLADWAFRQAGVRLDLIR